MVCNRCQKRPAIIFVQRMENGQMKNEGFCLHCRVSCTSSRWKT